MEYLDVHQRALRVNLDSKTFGTFAEIGAGQEVARWFLQVGGAAGTVAKTISAYDMKFSDEIYGAGSRYVSKDRLSSMLNLEYTLLHDRLAVQRGVDTQFFVFADTVSARNYAGTNECHGWLGMRYQMAPQSEPSEVLLHVNMMDSTNLLQQQALGLLGVNLVYSAFYLRESVQALLDGLFADLELDRLEIDVVELSGPAFGEVDPVDLGVKLIHGEMTRAVLFDEQSRLTQPSSVLRKRPLAIERGMFARVGSVHRQMLQDACSRLKEEGGSDRDPLGIPEISIKPVAGIEPPDAAETTRRLSGVFNLNQPVLLTNFPEVYHLTAYVRRYTSEPLRFVLGASTLVQVLHAAHYDNLVGGLLEALGRLFADKVKVYVFPMEVDTFNKILADTDIELPGVVPSTQNFVTAESIRLDAPIQYLYDYLLQAGWVVGLAPPAE